MGNNATGSWPGKNAGTGTNTGAPAWAPGNGNGVMPQSISPGTGTNKVAPAPAPGTAAYNNMNTQLQTAPMQAAVNMFQNGGMSPQMAGIMQQFLGGTGTNANMNAAAGAFGQAAGGDPKLQGYGDQSAQTASIGSQNFQDILNWAKGESTAKQNLSGMAAGDMLNNGNPYVDKMVADSQQDVADQTSALFASGGRYGSGAHQGTVSDSVARTGNELRNANYEAERGRQLQANQMIDSAEQGQKGIQQGAATGIAQIDQNNISNRLAGLGQAANITNQDTSNKLQGASGLGQIGQSQYGNRQQDMTSAASLSNQGIQNQLGMISQLPTIQGNKVFDAEQQGKVGSAIDSRTQAGLDDLIKKWQATDMQDWARLGGLLSASTGAAGNWGTQTTTSKQPMNILGFLGALAGAM